MTLSQSEIAARLEKVRLSYIESLQEKHDTLVACWSRLCSQWDADTYQTLYLILHSLAGAAETFGLREVSRLSRELVEQLRPHNSQQALSPNTMSLIGNALMKLQAEMKRCVAEQSFNKT